MFFVGFSFEKVSNYECLAGLRLTVYTRLTLNLQRSNYFCLQSPVITDVCHYTWLVAVEFKTKNNFVKVCDFSRSDKDSLCYIRKQ